VHIFYCAGWKIGEVAGVFLRTLAQRNRTLCLCVRCAGSAWLARVGHRTPGTERRLDPIGASGVLSLVLYAFAMLSGFKTGEHWTVWCSASGDPASLQTSLSLSPLRTGRVRCGFIVSLVLRSQRDSRWWQWLDFKWSKSSRPRTRPVAPILAQ